MSRVTNKIGQKTESYKIGVTMEQKMRWDDTARQRDMTVAQMIREAVEMYIAVWKRTKEQKEKASALK